MVNINGIQWNIVYVSPLSDKLMREDGSYTIGMTDNNTKCVYLSNELTGDLLHRVLCHELVHCACFSYDIQLDGEIEEILADFISLYGDEVTVKAENIFRNIMKVMRMHH